MEDRRYPKKGTVAAKAWEKILSHQEHIMGPMAGALQSERQREPGERLCKPS